MESLVPYAGAAAVLSSGFVVFKTIRPWFNVTVNCWFCNKNTVVPYGNKNCWDCPHCDQYNGFTQEGDYNKPIPTQHDELLNYPISANDAKEAYTPATNDLCELCNRNQLLKIKQLASFVPANEANYDNEVEAYREQLEYAYRLCRNCQASVCHKLAKQDHRLRSKLLEARLKDTDTSSIYGHITCKVHTPLHVSLLRFTSLLCAVTLLLVNTYHLHTDSRAKLPLDVTLPKALAKYALALYGRAQAVVFLGLFAGSGAIFLHGKYSLYLVDAMSSFTWLGLLVLHFDSTYLRRLPGLELSDIYLLQTGVSLFCTLLSMWCAVCKRAPVGRRRKKRKRSDLDGSNMSCDSSIAPSHAGDVSLASELDSFDALSQSSWGADSQFVEEPVDSQLDGLSLGTPQKRNAAPSVFQATSSRSSFAATPMLGNLSSLHKKRPLISPARFSPAVKKTSSSVKQNLFNQDGAPSDRKTKNSRPPEPEVNDHSSSSSSSSQCPVGTTTHVQEHKAGRKISLTHVVLFMSVAVNVGIVLYVAANRYLNVQL